MIEIGVVKQPRTWKLSRIDKLSSAFVGREAQLCVCRRRREGAPTISIPGLLFKRASSDSSLTEELLRP